MAHYQEIMALLVYDADRVARNRRREAVLRHIKRKKCQSRKLMNLQNNYFGSTILRFNVYVNLIYMWHIYHVGQETEPDLS